MVEQTFYQWVLFLFVMHKKQSSGVFSNVHRKFYKMKWSLWASTWKRTCLSLPQLKIHSDEAGPSTANGWERDAALPAMRLRALPPPKKRSISGRTSSSSEHRALGLVELRPDKKENSCWSCARGQAKLGHTGKNVPFCDHNPTWFRLAFVAQNRFAP